MADILDAAAQKLIDDAAKNVGSVSSAEALAKADPTTPPTTEQSVPTTPPAPPVEPEKPATLAVTEELPAEKPLIISVEPTATQTTTVKVEPAVSPNTIPPMPPAEPPPAPAADQPKSNGANHKAGKKGGKIGMMIAMALLLITIPVLGYFAGGSEMIADLRSRAVDPAICYNAAAANVCPAGYTWSDKYGTTPKFGCCKNPTTTTAPTPTPPPDTGGGGSTCSTAFTCNGICETNQTTINNFNNTWCDGVARWKWQACGEGSEPTAQKPNCGGAQSTPTPGTAGGNAICYNAAAANVCPAGYTWSDKYGTTPKFGCCKNSTTPTPGTAGGGGTSGTTREAGSCSNGSCTVDPSKNTLVICKCPSGLDANGDCAQNCEIIAGGGTANCQQLANQSCSSVQLDVKPAGIASPHDANDQITGTVVCNPNRVNNPSCNAPTTAVTPPPSSSCGNWCSPGGPWAGTCCNALSEGSQCKHTWVDGFNAACVTPTPPHVGGQCTRISVYKGAEKVTNLSTLKAGDQVTIGVAGSSASRGRIRVNGGAFTETATHNTHSEFTINFTIPTGVTSFTVEAEVMIGGAWK